MPLIPLEPPEDPPEPLETLLERRLPKYRARPVLECGAVRLQQSGQTARVIVRDGKTQVHGGDRIFVDDPLSQVCEQLLNKIPSWKYADQAAIPQLSDTFTTQWARLMDSRSPKTVHSLDVRSLVGFMRSLSRPAEPVGDLILVSHANPQGVLKIAMTDQDDAADIEFERLMAERDSKSLVAPDVIFSPRWKRPGGPPIDPRFHIRGCRIGRAIPFLDLLKQALGGRLTVTAPIHYNAVNNTLRPFGYFEFMLYGFQLNRSTPFRDRSEALREFLAASKANPDFKDVHGRRVAPEFWERIVPTPPKRKLNESSEIPEVVNHPISGRGERLESYWTVIRDTPWSRFPIANVEKRPTTKETVLAHMKDALVAWGNDKYPTANPYANNHPFPAWVRRGYGSMEEMLRGYDWPEKEWHWDSAKKTLYVTGTRMMYIVKRPIVDLSNELYVNWYPTKETRAKARPDEPPPRSGGAFLALHVEDKRFFRVR